MKRQIWALALALALLCGGCVLPSVGGEDSPGEGEYAVWFVVADRAEGAEGRSDSAVLDREFRPLPEGSGEIGGLLALLLAGPEREDLTSPFPADLALRSWRLEAGTVYVDLSETYGGLSGMELTLADGCIVLTLCQLEEVEAVYLTIQGRTRPFRDQVLTQADFLLDNALAGEEGPDRTEDEAHPEGVTEEGGDAASAGGETAGETE